MLPVDFRRNPFVRAPRPVSHALRAKLADFFHQPGFDLIGRADLCAGVFRQSEDRQKALLHLRMSVQPLQQF